MEKVLVRLEKNWKYRVAPFMTLQELTYWPLTLTAEWLFRRHSVIPLEKHELELMEANPSNPNIHHFHWFNYGNPERKKRRSAKGKWRSNYYDDYFTDNSFNKPVP